jgi:dTDP-glucose pyrophosphorylase
MDELLPLILKVVCFGTTFVDPERYGVVEFDANFKALLLKKNH